jgi:hypothetical protein
MQVGYFEVKQYEILIETMSAPRRFMELPKYEEESKYERKIEWFKYRVLISKATKYRRNSM